MSASSLEWLWGCSAGSAFNKEGKGSGSKCVSWAVDPCLIPAFKNVVKVASENIRCTKHAFEFDKIPLEPSETKALANVSNEKQVC